MKTFLILLLFLALLAAAHFTRPSRSSFDTLARDAVADSGAPAPAVAAELKQLRFVDHGLWVTVERNGRTLYVGAFAHWFDLGATCDKQPQQV